MDAPVDELMDKIKSLEAGHAELREEMSKIMISSGYNKQRRSSPVPPGYQFDERQCLNVLESLGRSIHIFDADGRIFYWKRSAENLYGYSATEAIGRTIYEILVSNPDQLSAKAIIGRSCMGETWTGVFPITHKLGHLFQVFATNAPIYDDDGTFIGIVCISCDSKLFKDTQVSTSVPLEEEMGQEFSKPSSSVTTRLGFDPDQPLQTAIASKITNLASKVSNKIRSKMKIVESNVFPDSESVDKDVGVTQRREEGNCSGASTSRGDPGGTPAGVFTSFATGKPTAHILGDSIDEGDGKPGIHKMITTKAEAWIGKKAMQWSGKGKGTERESPEDPGGTSAAKTEIPTGDNNRPIVNEASGSWSSFNVNSNSSPSSCGNDSSITTRKLDAETDFLDYEITWEDLAVGEQIGQGSCGTVYHGLWHGSDVAIKVFSKQEYSEEVIFSFKQEVSLMKQLRHPNILLFMGAVTSAPRLCIVTEFLPRGSLFRLLQRSTSKLDWRRRNHMALDIARGMNYLHNCNPPIVHRDLKSSNLLVDKNWGCGLWPFTHKARNLSYD
ncbi:uncharacterized protein LOC141606354 isoform X2 [Silene latifolia]|uniref:uncharacterized protein LOC141606354 isoform X2 n=1 Tax=Silene latifolia TaxID=37657 RepID=UPI003D78326C